MKRLIGVSQTLPGASETLLTSKPSPLNFDYEAARYLAWMMNHRSAAQRKLLHDFASSLQLPKDTRLITSIPVYAGEPQPLSTLVSLKRQGAVRGHQVVVFLNAGPGDSPKLLSDALLAMRSSPLPKNVTILQHHFPKKTLVGEIRGLLFDSIAIAALRCGLKDPVLISTDADVLGFSPKYLRSARRLFDRKPLLDFATGDVYWGLEHRRQDGEYPAFTKFPELFVTGEYWTSRLRANAAPGGLILFPGGNTLMRLASYCAIGGMDYSRVYSEDYQLGGRLQILRRMLHARGENLSQFFTFSENLFVIVNPRRWLHFILNDYLQKPSEMDVTRTKGSLLDLAKMEGKYRGTGTLIQQSDIRSAMTGNPKSLAHVRKRMNFLLRELVRYDRALKSTDMLRDVLEQMKIKFKKRAPFQVEIEAGDLRRIFHIGGAK